MRGAIFNFINWLFVDGMGALAAGRRAGGWDDVTTVGDIKWDSKYVVGVQNIEPLPRYRLRIPA